jgi:hypothetical protein
LEILLKEPEPGKNVLCIIAWFALRTSSVFMPLSMEFCMFTFTLSPSCSELPKLYLEFLLRLLIGSSLKPPRGDIKLCRIFGSAGDEKLRSIDV